VSEKKEREEDKRKRKEGMEEETDMEEVI